MQVQNKKDILLKLKKHRAILKNFGVEQIGLFGSFVKNRQKENSDVDLLVKFDKSKKHSVISFSLLYRNAMRLRTV